MRQTPFFLKLTLTAAALLGGSLASAQSLIIDSTTTALQTTVGQSSVIIDPVSGNVTVRSASGNACAVTPAPVVSVTTTATNVQSQQQISVSWSATNTTGSTPCTPSSSPTNSSWNLGASAASGTRTVTMPTVAQGQTQNQILTMTCTGNGSGSNGLTVPVQGPGQVAGCEGTPESGLSNQGNPGQWTDLFPGFVFPQPLGNTREVEVATGSYVAIAFNSGVTAANLRKFTIGEGNFTRPARLSVSRCPGDFRPDVLNVGQRCLAPGDSAQQDVLFQVNSNAPSASLCTLTPNTTYYVNITFKVPQATGNHGDHG